MTGFVDPLAGDELRRRLADATGADDEENIAQMISDLVEQICAGELSLVHIEGASKLLKRECRFDEVVKIAEATISRERFEGTPLSLLRTYCLALIENGAYYSAGRVLSELARRVSRIEPCDDAVLDEQAKVSALQGRNAKQRYIAYRDERHLVEAVARYAAAYSKHAHRRDGVSRSKAIWHGGNLLAVSKLAERHSITVEDHSFEPEQLADALQHLIGPHLELLNVFERGTLIEVMMALDTPESQEQAITIARGLSTALSAAPFQLAIVRRQLSEIWECGQDHPVLTALDGEALHIGLGATVTLAAGSRLEKMVGPERPLYHDVLERAIEVAYPVCMITEIGGTAVGTGFLMPGNEWHQGLSDDLVLVTNNHVTTSQPRNDRPTASPDQVRARFELLDDSKRNAITVGGLRELWTDIDLDITILQIDAPVRLARLSPIRIAESLPSTQVADPYVFVIGHPLGQRLSYSVRGNELIEVGDTLLHYKAPTANGSSGSPVFNAAFELIGVHRGGGFSMPSISNNEVRRPANEAVTALAIRSRIASAHLG